MNFLRTKTKALNREKLFFLTIFLIYCPQEIGKKNNYSIILDFCMRFLDLIHGITSTKLWNQEPNWGLS
jgi:hypothetical protein